MAYLLILASSPVDTFKPWVSIPTNIPTMPFKLSSMKKYVKKIIIVLKVA